MLEKILDLFPKTAKTKEEFLNLVTGEQETKEYIRPNADVLSALIGQYPIIYYRRHTGRTTGGRKVVYEESFTTRLLQRYAKK